MVWEWDCESFDVGGEPGTTTDSPSVCWETVPVVGDGLASTFIGTSQATGFSKWKTGSSFQPVWIEILCHSSSRSSTSDSLPLITNHHFLILPSCADLNFLLMVSFSHREADTRRLTAPAIAEQAVDRRVPQIFLALLTGALLFLWLRAIQTHLDLLYL